jgi:multidrug transporter EmrE-like cation transporter
MGLALLLMKKDEKDPPVPLKKVWHYITIMAVALFFVNYLKTTAAQTLPAAHVYPLYQGGVLVVASLMAAIFFGEKITLRCVLGILMTFAAMLMMNVL